MNLSARFRVYISETYTKKGNIVASETELIRSQLLLHRYRRGDSDAFEELVTIWEKPIFYYIRRIVAIEEDAWDVSQEVWFQVARKIYQLRDLEKLPAWLYQIARHKALNHCRANRRWEALTDDVDHLPDMLGDVSVDFSRAEVEAIHWGLDQLPLTQREVLTLKFLEEFTLKEISEITKVPVGTVKSRLFFAKKSLRTIIEKERLSYE